MGREWESDSVNRFELGMEIYARLQSEIAAAQTPPAETAVEAAQTAGEPPSPKAPLPLGELENTLWVETPALRSLLDGLSPLPAGNLLIGATEDELPLLYDLTQPDPGSLLITGGPRSGKTRLMRAILTSGCAIHSPRRFRFCVLGTEPEALNPLLDYPHCYKIAQAERDSAYRLIVELANLAEERRYGRGLGSPVILAIVDLPGTLAVLDPEICDLLAWLVRFGPESQVYTVAELDTGRFADVPSATVRCFGAWLAGSLKGSAHLGVENFCACNPNACQAAENLIHGAQFCVYTGDEWVPFWIPNVYEEDLK